MTEKKPRKFKTAPTGAGAALILLIAGWLAVDEGLVLTRYVDIAGIPTICFGHTGKGVSLGKATEEQCEGLLWEDTRKAIAAVDRAFKVDLQPHEMAAVVRWTYNFGEGRLRTATFVRLANEGKPPREWCPHMLNWVFITDPDTGRKLDCRDPANKCGGLPQRRQEEVAMCLGLVQP